MNLLVAHGPNAGTLYPLREGKNYAGREEGCEIVLPSRRVSRKHAVFHVKGATCVVQDLESANGILVNGHKMPACTLVDGTHVQIGDIFLVYQAGEAAPAPSHEPIRGEETIVRVTVPSTEPVRPKMGATLNLAKARPAEAAPFGAQPAAQPAANFAAPATFGAQPAPFGEQPAATFGAQPAPTGLPFGAVPDVGLVPDEDLKSIAPSKVPAALRASRAQRLPWSLRLAGVLALCGLLLMCGPFGGFASLLSGARANLVDMAVHRGEAVAEGIGHRNAAALASQNLIGLDLSPVIDEPGVVESMILDTRGAVLAPAEKSRTSLKGSAIFALVLTERRTVAIDEGDAYAILAPVRAAEVDGGPKNTVGYAYLRYDAAGVAGEAGQFWLRGLVSLLWMGLAGLTLLLGLRALVLRPLEQLREETELAIKGDVPDVTASTAWKQLEALAHSISRMHARARGVAQPAADRLPIALAAIDTVAFAIGEDGRITDANAWALHFFGAQKEQVIGRAPAELVPEPEVRDILASLFKVLADGQREARSEPFPLRGDARTVTVAGDAARGRLKTAVVVIR